jgi:hypothetical protein
VCFFEVVFLKTAKQAATNKHKASYNEPKQSNKEVPSRQEGSPMTSRQALQ